MNDTNRYVPALRVRALTRWYDPVLRAVFKEERVKALLVRHVQVAPGGRCARPELRHGDAHHHAQADPPGGPRRRPRRGPCGPRPRPSKVAAAGMDVALVEGLAYAPPFAPASFDQIVSSLLFHHLTTAQKRRALAAAFDLLTPGGALHLADWGRAQDPLMRAASLGIQLLDGFGTTGDNVRGELIPLMRQAGSTAVAGAHHERTVVGTLSLYRAGKPRTTTDNEATDDERMG